VVNNARGIAQLVRRLKKLSADGIVLEASGGFELAAVSELAAAGLPVMVVNPRQVRDFARASGDSPKPTPTTRASSRTLQRSCSHSCGDCLMLRAAR
jgi:transposase